MPQVDSKRIVFGLRLSLSRVGGKVSSQGANKFWGLHSVGSAVAPGTPGTKRRGRIACTGLNVQFVRLDGEVNIRGASRMGGGESGLTRGLSIVIPGTWGAGGRGWHRARPGGRGTFCVVNKGGRGAGVRWSGCVTVPL